MDFTDYIDLAAERLDASVLAANNEFFAPKENLLRAAAPVWKSAEEMLALLEQRLQNDPARELPTAAEQQRQITRLRLEKFLAGERSS